MSPRCWNDIECSRNCHKMCAKLRKSKIDLRRKVVNLIDSRLSAADSFDYSTWSNHSHQLVERVLKCRIPVWWTKMYSKTKIDDGFAFLKFLAQILLRIARGSCNTVFWRSGIAFASRFTAFQWSGVVFGSRFAASWRSEVTFASRFAVFWRSGAAFASRFTVFRWSGVALALRFVVFRWSGIAFASRFAAFWHSGSHLHCVLRYLHSRRIYIAFCSIDIKNVWDTRRPKS